MTDTRARLESGELDSDQVLVLLESTLIDRYATECETQESFTRLDQYGPSNAHLFRGGVDFVQVGWKSRVVPSQRYYALLGTWNTM